MAELVSVRLASLEKELWRGWLSKMAFQRGLLDEYECDPTMLSCCQKESLRQASIERQLQELRQVDRSMIPLIARRSVIRSAPPAGGHKEDNDAGKLLLTVKTKPDSHLSDSELICQHQHVNQSCRDNSSHSLQNRSFFTVDHVEGVAIVKVVRSSYKICA